jgi:nudix-type nucleoside diphosphatase (YffH/AdpP family)
VPDYLKPIEDTPLSHLFGRVEKHVFDYRRRNGEWQRLTRETYDSGDGAAVLLCDPAAGEVVLIRQFRYPAFHRGEPAFLIEACAGKLEGDGPEACARREAVEETGYTVGRIEQAYDCFMSPGSVTERLTLFIGWIEGRPGGAGGGLVAEGEDIEVLRLPFAEALAMTRSGAIADAKTVMLLQYAALNRIFG